MPREPRRVKQGVWMSTGHDSVNEIGNLWAFLVALALYTDGKAVSRPG